MTWGGNSEIHEPSYVSWNYWLLQWRYLWVADCSRCKQWGHQMCHTSEQTKTFHIFFTSFHHVILGSVLFLLSPSVYSVWFNQHHLYVAHVKTMSNPSLITKLTGSNPNLIVVLCGMPTIQYSARSTRLSVRLSKLACPNIVQVVKVSWRKAHRHHRWMVQLYSPSGGTVSSHDGTLVPPGEYDWTCAHLSPQPKRQIDRFRFLHSAWQKVPILYNGHDYPPELPLPMGGFGRPI